MHRGVALLAAAALLGGCSFMPPYQRPPAPIPLSWPEEMPPGGARHADGIDWHSFFPDPRLQALLAAAMENNRDLRIAVARVEEARAQYGIQRADRLPTVTAGASRSLSRTPANLSVTGREMTLQRYDVNLGVTVFELDFWGRVASLSEAARASYLATEEAQRAFRLSLISDVANAYLTQQEMEERLVLAQRTVDTRGETRKLVDKRREVGLATDLDFLQADAAYQLAVADVASLRRQRANAQNLLRALVGGEPADLPPGRSLLQQDIVPDLDAGMPSDMLLRRPDVLAAEQRLMAANASIGAARAAFFPRIALTAALGTASPALAGLFDSGSGAWSFVPSLTLPLFDAGRNAANVDLAQARRNIAVADYERTVQQAFREVADLLAARDTLHAQLAAQEEVERAQNRRLVLAEARYRQGISSFLEVLDAQRDAFSAEQNVVQTRRALLSAAAQLYKALGGGA